MRAYKKDTVNTAQPNKWLRILGLKEISLCFSRMDECGGVWRSERGSNCSSRNLLLNFVIKFKQIIFQNKFMYICNMYMYTYTNLPINIIVRLPQPRSGDSQSQETFLAPSADKQTGNYDTKKLKPPSLPINPKIKGNEL